MGDERILDKCILCFSGKLIVPEDYISKKIPKKQAEELKSQEKNWDDLRIWV